MQLSHSAPCPETIRLSEQSSQEGTPLFPYSLQLLKQNPTNPRRGREISQSHQQSLLHYPWLLQPLMGIMRASGTFCHLTPSLTPIILFVNKSDLLPPFSAILTGKILRGLCDITVFEFRALFY